MRNLHNSVFKAAMRFALAVVLMIFGATFFNPTSASAQVNTDDGGTVVPGVAAPISEERIAQIVATAMAQAMAQNQDNADARTLNLIAATTAKMKEGHVTTCSDLIFGELSCKFIAALHPSMPGTPSGVAKAIRSWKPDRVERYNKTLLRMVQDYTCATWDFTLDKSKEECRCMTPDEIITLYDNMSVLDLTLGVTANGRSGHRVHKDKAKATPAKKGTVTSPDGEITISPATTKGKGCTSCGLERAKPSPVKPVEPAKPVKPPSK